MREIIFQAFNWKLKDIEAHLPLISAQGFTMIQTSPMQDHKESSNPAWFLTYQPTNFKVGNRLGTRGDLRSLCAQADYYGLKVVVDCVVNHLANEVGRCNNSPSLETDPSLLARPDFFRERRTVENYDDRYQCTQFGIGMPDLNTHNHDLQQIIKDYLLDLQSLGVKGYRFDAAKHIELPDDEGFGSDFWPNVLDLPHKDKLFFYGELLYVDTCLADRYSHFMNVGVNNGAGSDESKKVRWTFSHDDHLTFNLYRPEAHQHLLDEWSNLLGQHQKSHVLFYPQGEDSFWRSECMRNINLNQR